MAKILCTRTPLNNHQLTFLRAHILRERQKAKLAASVEKPPLVTNISPPGSCSEDSGADESPSQKSERLPSTSVDASERPPSGMDSWSTEQPEAKSTEKGKEDQETPEDITKQIESLQTHLDSLKAEKHRLFQQLKMVLHEEDEKRMKEVEQKQQEMEKSVGVGGEFVSPLDPRLAQASSLGKHPHPISPSTGSLGPPPLKKQASRGPLLPTPDTPYMRQGSTGPFRHLSNSDSYHPPSHPANPYPPPHQYPTPPPAQRTPYQDQRAGHAHQVTSHTHQVAGHQVTQDVHMQGVHGNHPPPPLAQPGITYIQQPQYQGMAMAAPNYQYPTSAPYSILSSSTQSVVQLSYQPQQPQPQPQQQQQQQQLAPPHPGPQGYQAMPHLAPHQQVYAQAVSQEVMMQQQPPQPGQFPHYLSQGSGGQIVTGGQVYSDLAPPPQGPYSVLPGSAVQDPRQQKLLMEHQRGVAGNASGGSTPLVKPPYPKQESHQASHSTRGKHD